MRTLLVIATFIIGTPCAVTAQHLVAGSQMEYTVAGIQTGASVWWINNRQWAAGAFHQVAIWNTGEVNKGSSFSGLQLAVPVAKGEKIRFVGLVRGGLANERFFIVVPGFETQLAIGKRAGFACGMSFRMGYPALTSRVYIKLFH